MKKIQSMEGITIALCQMKVVLGRPDLNAAYIVEEINAAARRGVDIIIFPELCTTGYFIGDLFEDEALLRDVEYLNRRIREATKAEPDSGKKGIAAVVGTPVMVPQRKGEDGRGRILNSAVVYQNGRYVGHVAKTLQPNYRMFDDDRHFFSLRKAMYEEGKRPEDGIAPFPLTLAGGRTLRLGVMLCEDIWHEFYPLNPAKILAQKGAELLCSISASPWTWQKNRKRHHIVKGLAQECRVPFVYVNNTGTQNTGKNIIIFDGCSAVYDGSGRIVHEVPAYAEGTHDVILTRRMRQLPEPPQDDTKELYQAIRCAITEFFAALPPERRRVLIGLSGGIDSSLSAALYADALGPQNVSGVNMPSKFSSAETQELARTVAANLGIAYDVRPIQEIVDVIASHSGVREGTPSYENIQARSRMEILAARAQELHCVFSANWNKVEAAFGYGTLYGDMAGALALIGDLVKREVYQLADYMNRVVFGREVIPRACFDIPPTAELRPNQRDPFDYGRIDRRGYHEEMVRAFTEFRRNPEWFLDLYAKGFLEQELKLAAGRLQTLFPTARHFIHDLEKHWRMFFGAYFKRIQGPPIPIVSKRAFGLDLRESLLSPHFTRRYFDLRAQILAQEPRRIAIYGGSFNPPALHHRAIALQLLAWFDEVVIVPCGIRDEKDSLKAVPLQERKEMAMLCFGDLPRVRIDLYDLEQGVFTPAYELEERYKKNSGDKGVWHVIGGDLVAGGGAGGSEIQRSWKQGETVWRTLNFAVVVRPGLSFDPEDLPPSSEVFEGEGLVGASTRIRELIAEGKDVAAVLKPEVYEYIKEHGLYQKPQGDR